MKNFIKLKSAFTMIELVIVIVVLGILAAIAMSGDSRDVRQEAADNILSAIRYTQHQALIDDKADPNDPNWQQKLWAIRFSGDGNGGFFYTISSDEDQDQQVDKIETAIDPANGKYMFNFGGNNIVDTDESPNIFIGNDYGINNLDFTNCTATAAGANNAQHVAFDHFGRPHKGILDSNVTNNYSTVMTQNCVIVFDSPNFDNNITINIEKETGYAFIQGQDDS